MGLTDYLRTALALPSRNAVIPAWPPGFDNFNGLANLVSGQTFPLNLTQTISGEDEEQAVQGMAGLFSANAIVWACISTRLQLFSEARPRYQRLEKGKPGDLWGDPSLGILEHPWPGGATSDLLGRADQDISIWGNFYAIRRGGRILRLPPHWVNILLSDPDAIDAEVLGYAYYPGGEYSGAKPVLLQRDEVAHYAPYPDPQARFRGMSWLTPVVREVYADNATTNHKLQFFRNGATPNMIVKRGTPAAGETFKEWVKTMREASEGTQNAYRTFYMSQGADATVVGKDFQQIELKATQGAGEVRIITASGLHPVIVGVSESLQGSSLNQGNFNAARRLTADTYLRPSWRNFFQSMETVVPPPAGSRLWYDDRDIPFLREDAKDAAEIMHIQVQAANELVREGWDPESAKKAVLAQNLDLLKHTGLVSVQLQPPGTTTEPVPTNGKVPAEVE